MHATRTPLQAWFLGAYLVTTQTPGVSAVQLQRQLGLARYETAFQMLHKFRAGMVRPNRDRIGADSPVEVDETLVGGRTKGEGRGVHHKATVAGAIEVRPRALHVNGKRPQRAVYAGRLRLCLVPNRSAKTLTGFVQENVVKGAVVRTDGWDGYDALTKLGYAHEPMVQGGDGAKTDAHLPMIQIAFSNLKTWLMGTHHGGVSQQHLPAYLNEFVFRFNRRFYPMTAFASILGIDVNLVGPTYRGLYDGTWEHGAQPDKATPLQVAYWCVNRIGKLWIDEICRDCNDKSKPIEVRRLGRTIARWRTQIVAWHQTHVPNGPTEAINNLIKPVKPTAFGFRRFQNYRIRALPYTAQPNWDLPATITPH